MKSRHRKHLISARALADLVACFDSDMVAWQNMPPVGREWGSPDYERLSRIDELLLGATIERCAKTGLFVGHVPGIPGAHSQGATRDELEDNLREVLEMIISGATLRASIQDVPKFLLKPELRDREN